MRRIFSFNSCPPAKCDVCGQLISSDGFLHHRRSFEYNVLIAVTEGVLYISSDGADYEVSAGQYILLKANGEHYGYKPSAGRLSYMWAHFSAESDCGGGECSFPEYGSIANTERVFFLFRQLLELSLEEHTIQRSMSDCTLNLLLMELSREYLAEADGSSDKLPPVITSVCEWIRSNYYRQFTVAQLGELFGYQADYLSSLFKKRTGVSIVRYTNQIRIKSAKNLLLNYGLSVKETAYSCGFADEKYFMRIFREYEGVTPTQYKEGLKEH